jgi:hypothetical protein
MLSENWIYTHVQIHWQMTWMRKYREQLSVRKLGAVVAEFEQERLNLNWRCGEHKMRISTTQCLLRNVKLNRVNNPTVALTSLH